MEIWDFIFDIINANKEVISASTSALFGAVIGWLTSIFRTRKSRLEDTFKNLNFYDDDDLVFVKGELVPLSSLTIVKKGKNANENESEESTPQE
ncbi:hypothetical protein [Capybara microvirus Cap1_SP_206]|nr:hypothetical protein [Capybara microvirus Cap1_SP_206]